MDDVSESRVRLRAAEFVEQDAGLADAGGVGLSSAQPLTASNPKPKSTAISEFDMVFPPEREFDRKPRDGPSEPFALAFG